MQLVRQPPYPVKPPSSLRLKLSLRLARVLRTLRCFNQLVANFDVIGEWRAWAQLPEPLFGNQIRQSPKAEYENVNGVSFAGRRVFDEITPASGTVILNERLSRLDLDSTPRRAKTTQAVLPKFA